MPSPKRAIHVSGIDLSRQASRSPKRHDATHKVAYQIANAYSLPYPDQTFDVVCAMDVLEHVEEPASTHCRSEPRLKTRRPLFLPHLQSQSSSAISSSSKGSNGSSAMPPKTCTSIPSSSNPKNSKNFAAKKHSNRKASRLSAPNFLSAFFKMLFTRKVPEDFGFCFSKSLATGYCGFAQKRGKLWLTFKGKPVKTVGNLPASPHKGSRFSTRRQRS